MEDTDHDGEGANEGVRDENMIVPGVKKRGVRGSGRRKGTIGCRVGARKSRKKEGPCLPSYVQYGALGGGPSDETVLKSFREHVAHAIWVGTQEVTNDKGAIDIVDLRSKVIKLQHHYKKFTQWNYKDESERFKELYMSSGLAELSRATFSTVDHVLVSSIVERWHLETNTFHLPFGEMTISLDDIKQILHVPVIGKPVVGTGSFGTQEAKALLVEALGVDDDEATNALDGSTVVQHDWLVRTFSRDKDKRSEEQVERSVRAYHLFVLGCLVFTDKSGTKISVQYLQFLKDLKEIPKYNWGSAILAYLYCHLGIACKAETTQMGRCSTLLQVWIHEHLSFGNPIKTSPYDENSPRAYKWTARPCSGIRQVMLNTYRETLDDINRSMVVWEPYACHRSEHPFPEISFFKGCLLCLDIVEAYHPDRVMRQFGRYQSIPELPITPSGYSVDIAVFAGYLQSWANHCLASNERERPVTDGWDAVHGYAEWYDSITHRIVQNPMFRLSEIHGEQQNGSVRSSPLEGGLVQVLENGLSLCQQGPCHPNLHHVLTMALSEVRQLIANGECVKKVASKNKQGNVTQQGSVNSMMDCIVPVAVAIAIAIANVTTGDDLL